MGKLAQQVFHYLYPDIPEDEQIKIDPLEEEKYEKYLEIIFAKHGYLLKDNKCNPFIFWCDRITYQNYKLECQYL